MKHSIWGLSLALLLTLPVVASARHHHNSSQPPTSTPPTTTNPPNTPVAPPPVTTISGTCLNYGYQPIQNGQYDMNQVASDLAHIKKAGINCLRLAFYGTNSEVTKPLALAAKASGFYVIIGNDGDPTSSSYGSGVVDEATWAQQNKIDQVSIGNEAEYNTGKGYAVEPYLTNLSCQVRNVFSGVISYDTTLNGLDPIQNFHNIGLGCIDLLGLNNYAGYSETMAEAQHLLPGHYYVSETNLDCTDKSQPCADDATWAQNLQNVKAIYDQYNVPVYWFAYNAGGDGTSPKWSISTHPQVAAILGL